MKQGGAKPLREKSPARLRQEALEKALYQEILLNAVDGYYCEGFYALFEKFGHGLMMYRPSTGDGPGRPASRSAAKECIGNALFALVLAGRIKWLEDPHCDSFKSLKEYNDYHDNKPPHHQWSRIRVIGWQGGGRA